jgi:hypothetical protein
MATSTENPGLLEAEVQFQLLEEFDRQASSAAQISRVQPAGVGRQTKWMCGGNVACTVCRTRRLCHSQETSNTVASPGQQTALGEQVERVPRVGDRVAGARLDRAGRPGYPELHGPFGQLRGLRPDAREGATAAADIGTAPSPVHETHGCQGSNKTC